MTSVNLLRPRLPSRQSVVRRRYRAAGAVLLVLMAASLGAHGWMRLERQRAAEAAAAVEARLAAEMRAVKEWQALQREIGELEERGALLQQVPAAEERFAALAGQIDAAAPPGCALESLVLGPGDTLSLTGSAPSHGAAADYVDRLRALPGVAGLEVQSLVAADDGRVIFDLRGAMGGRSE